MKKRIDLEVIFLVFCDLMLWSSIPILAITEIWESHLALSANIHELMQILIFMIFIVWAWFWFSTGEYQRYRYVQSLRTLQYISPTRVYIFSSFGIDLTKDTRIRVKKITNDNSDESDERKYDTDN